MNLVIDNLMNIKINNIINSPDKMLKLAKLALKDSDHFKYFKKRIPDYIGFYILTCENEILSMSGIFKSKFWDSQFVRVCDHTYYFKKSLNMKIYYWSSDYMLPVQTKIAIEKNLIPFYSILKQRNALKKLTKRFNSKNKYQYLILPKLYYTCNNEPTNDPLCWQNVAILKTKGYESFNLPSKSSENQNKNHNNFR